MKTQGNPKFDFYGRKIKSRVELYNYRGYEGIYGKYWFRLQYDARRRNLPFTITIQEAWESFMSQKGRCKISGETLKFPSKSGGSDGTASLDRIDSTKGYEPQNIQWVHKEINRMKGKMTDDQFIDTCRKIAKFNESLEKDPRTPQN